MAEKCGNGNSGSFDGVIAALQQQQAVLVAILAVLQQHQAALDKLVVGLVTGPTVTTH